MTTQVSLTVVCDVCNTAIDGLDGQIELVAQADQEVRSTLFGRHIPFVQLGGGKHDLCAECAQPVYAAFEKMVKDRAGKAGG